MNPLIQRFARSRLRLQALVFWTLLSLIIGAFLFFLPFVITYSIDGDLVEASRATLIPVIIWQGVILMLMGTGAVAGGITQEKVERILDYQRMAPLSNRKKIFGYLFGLPIREYLMWFTTLPFLAFAIVGGEIPFENWAPFYLVFMTSVVLYHMTGFAAGMVSTKWRLSARLSQGLVVMLYLVIPPVASQFGIIYFEYLTIRPAFFQLIQPLIADFPLRTIAGSIPSTLPFFHLSLSNTVFSLILQGGFFCLLYHVVFRKWRRAESTSLNKLVGLVAFLIILLIGLGNIWPFFSPLTDSFWMNRDLMAKRSVGQMALILLTLTSGALIVLIVSPDRLAFRQGYIRSLKLGHGRLGIWQEESPNRRLTGVFGLIFSVATFYLLLSPIPEQTHPGYQPVTVLFTLFLAMNGTLILFQLQAVKEFFGMKGNLLWLLLVWLTPILLALILLAANTRAVETVAYVLALSPAGLLAVFVLDGVSYVDPALRMLAVDFRPQQLFGLFVLAVNVGFLQLYLHRWHQKTISDALGEKTVD